MISIRPGYSAEYVLEHLHAAWSGAQTVQGSLDDQFNAYNAWATNHLRTLGACLPQAEVDRLITTRRYWALLGTSPGNYGSQLSNLIQLELSERVRDLWDAHEALRLELRDTPQGSHVMAVLDTNVLMHHFDALTTHDWHETINERHLTSLIVWIPIAVVDELDRLKRDNAPFRPGITRRSAARQALRTLDDLFYEPRRSVLVTEGRFRLQLLLDEPGHVRATPMDAEIIDRALSLSAIAARTHLLTYDLGMSFKAKSAGLKVTLLQEPEEVPKRTRQARPPEPAEPGSDAAATVQ